MKLKCQSNVKGEEGFVRQGKIICKLNDGEGFSALVSQRAGEAEFSVQQFSNK